MTDKLTVEEAFNVLHAALKEDGQLPDEEEVDELEPETANAFPDAPLRTYLQIGTDEDEADEPEDKLVSLHLTMTDSEALWLRNELDRLLRKHEIVQLTVSGMLSPVKPRDAAEEEGEPSEWP